MVSRCSATISDQSDSSSLSWLRIEAFDSSITYLIALAVSRSKPLTRPSLRSRSFIFFSFPVQVFSPFLAFLEFFREMQDSAARLVIIEVIFYLESCNDLIVAEFLSIFAVSPIIFVMVLSIFCDWRKLLTIDTQLWLRSMSSFYSPPASIKPTNYEYRNG